MTDNRTNHAFALFLTLKTVFNELELFVGFHHSRSLFNLRALAKRLAQTFDSQLQCHEEVLALLQSGILFAKESNNILFLEVLVEFNYKLSNKDKMFIANFLDEEIHVKETSYKFYKYSL